MPSSSSPSPDMTGRILKGIGGLYTVQTEQELCTCKARGIFRYNRQQLLVGDLVELEEQPDGSRVISAILPHKNALIRPALANLDCIVIFLSAAPPVTDPFLVDKVLSIAEYNRIVPILCINKCDLDAGHGFDERYRHFPLYRISAQTGEGLDTLKAQLEGKLSAFTGNSGVGKSSVLHRMFPELPIAVGDLSDKLGRGKNTTRHVELFPLDGGYVADTPGFSAFDITRVEKLLASDLPGTFPEMRPYLEQCRYLGCRHIKEQDCAVREAVQRGDIPAGRYESYCQLYELLKDLRPWQFKEE